MSRALPSAILPRVAQLLRMLGSDRDGEVVAAAGALRRTLAGAGVDLHDLSAVVESPAAVPAAAPKRPASRKARKAPGPRPAEPQSTPPPKPPHRDDLVQLTAEQRVAILKGLAEAVEDAEGRLNDWQRRFAGDLVDMMGRRHLRPTERQLAQAERIVRIVRGIAV